MSDKQLQREFAVARQIHAGMRGDSREVVLPAPPDVPEQGRKMAIRIGVAFMVLMFVNVGIGLWFIFRHESKNPNRPLLEAQMREQIAKSIERAASLTPAPNVLGVTEITIPAETGKMDTVADKVVTIAFGSEDLLQKVFRTQPPQRSCRCSIKSGTGISRSVASIAEERPASSAFAEATADKPTPATETSPATGEKKSFVVQIVEKQ